MYKPTNKHMYELAYVRTLKSKLSNIENKIMENNGEDIEKDIDDVTDLLTSYLIKRNKPSDDNSASQSEDYYSDSDSNQDINDVPDYTENKSEKDCENKLHMENERDQMIKNTLIDITRLRFAQEFINIEEETEEYTEIYNNSETPDNHL